MNLKSPLFPAKYMVCFLLGSLLSITSLTAQNYQQGIDFIKQFKVIQDQLPRESIYLHTDREQYYAEESIWFSAYVAAGGYLRPSNISNVLYVELVAPNGNIIKRNLIQVEDGRAEGSIKLDDKIAAGMYQIQAYTKWALHFGESYQFKKQILIQNAGNEIVRTGKKGSTTDLQFFPESGYLVQNIPTNIGFKAIGENGLGVPISGVIEDQDGEIVTEFSSQHRGMGILKSFTPKAGEQYFAITENNRVKLPEVQNSGVIVELSEDGTFYKADIKTTEHLLNKSFVLFAHVRGVIYHASPITLTDTHVSDIIPKKAFPSGIVHFTLLNEQALPVAERLTFSKNPVDRIRIETDLDEEIYQKRERVELILTAKDHAGDLIKGSASISVFDQEASANADYGQNIINHLLLGTEIKGHIEDPGFYFSEDEKADEYLNLLLLTQGWRAYKMDRNELDQQLKSLSEPEKGVTISGKVTPLTSNTPLENAVVLLSLGSDEDSQLITTDENGEFSSQGLSPFGPKTVTVKANREDGSDRVWITLYDQFQGLPNQMEPLPQPSLNNTEEADQLPSEQRFAENAIRNNEQYAFAQMSGDLGEFTITGKAENSRRNQFEQNSSEATSTSGMGTTIDMENDPGPYENLSIEQILAQQPGVNYNFSTKSLTLRVGFSNLGGAAQPPPLFIVDGMETSFGAVSALSTNNIKSIRINRSFIDNTIYGAQGAGGSIIIETKSGVNSIKENERGYKYGAVEGFQTPTLFYEPKYGVNVPRDLSQQDDRITLHWNPSLEISGETLKTHFWTNDIPSTYRVVIEGISENGLPFYATKTFGIND